MGQRLGRHPIGEARVDCTKCGERLGDNDSVCSHCAAELTETPEGAPEGQVRRVRPWVRFWARCLDMLLLVLFVGIPLRNGAPSVFDARWAAFSLLGLFLWIFLESILLSTWGTTPGRWLLKTTVRDLTGRRLTFAGALRRSFSVWWRGLGAGIPIVIIITCAIAYRRLTQDRMTRWDRDGQLQVTHEQIGGVRVTAAILLFILIAWLNLVP